jgi:hypothetical protein
MDQQPTSPRDPLFNHCSSDEEFDAAWAAEARAVDAERSSRPGRGREQPPRDRWTVIRRQASERDADLRLREQYDRAEPEVHEFEQDDEADYAAVLAEVPVGVRVDGWTGWRRTLFLEKLEEHGSILAAARAVGMSRRSVYRLIPRAPAFAAAFESAMSRVTTTLADTLFDRAIHGHQVPVLHGGDVVATRTIHHDMLGLYLLRVRDPLNYAPAGEADRYLAGRGLTPLRQRAQAAALSPAAVPLPGPAYTAATSDLCDLVQEWPLPHPSRGEPATGEGAQPPSGPPPG